MDHFVHYLITAFHAEHGYLKHAVTIDLREKSSEQGISDLELYYLQYAHFWLALLPKDQRNATLCAVEPLTGAALAPCPVDHDAIRELAKSITLTTMDHESRTQARIHGWASQIRAELEHTS